MISVSFVALICLKEKVLKSFSLLFGAEIVMWVTMASRGDLVYKQQHSTLYVNWEFSFKC